MLIGSKSPFVRRFSKRAQKNRPIGRQWIVDCFDGSSHNNRELNIRLLHRQ